MDASTHVILFTRCQPKPNNASEFSAPSPASHLPLRPSIMLQFPTTPTANPFLAPHQPHLSSPLAPSPASSPVSAAQSRRRTQYKARGPPGPHLPFSYTPRAPSTPAPNRRTSRRASGPATAPALRAQGSSPQEPPQTAFLRERFRARCAEHAARARERGVRERRWGGGRSSDAGGSSDAEMELDEEDEDDESVMADEVGRSCTMRRGAAGSDG